MEREPRQNAPSDPGPPPARFVWPPKPLPSDQALREMLRQAVADRDQYESPAQESLTPPAPEPAGISVPQHHSSITPAPTPPAPTPPTPWHRILGTLQQIELALLQPTILTLAERARRADWMPDGPDTWCQRCGEPVGPHERSPAGCRACHAGKLPWDRFVRLGTLEGELRQWVHEIKFARGHRLARELGQLLGTQVALAMGLDEPEAAEAAGAGAFGSCVVAPVPTTYRRRLVRGIDHAKQIATGVSAKLGVPCARLLERDHARPQRGLPKTERLKNARGIFRVRADGHEPSPGLVVLVDDVRTTGATLGACARELRRAMGDQVQICVAAVAIASPERDR